MTRYAKRAFASRFWLILPSLAFLVLASTSYAETIGHIHVDKCEFDRCFVLDPRNGRMIGDGDLSIDTKDIKAANTWYDRLAKADAVLKKRGFSDAARVVLLWNFGRPWNNADSDATIAAIETYLRGVHDNTGEELGALWHDFSNPLGILLDVQNHPGNIADFISYDPVSGKAMNLKNLETQVQTVPSCFAGGNPKRDCAPLRYDPWTGCFLSEAQSAQLLGKAALWRTDGLGPLAILPSKQTKSQIDLSNAKRQTETKVASKPKTPPVPGTPDWPNPAKRKACTW